MPIVALVADLIFESKLAVTAGQLGCDVQIVRTPQAVVAAAPDAEGLILDLNAGTGDVLELIRGLKRSHPEKRIIAFLAHVQVELGRAAAEAGADQVLPRSIFTQRLPELLRSLRAADRES